MPCLRERRVLAGALSLAPYPRLALPIAGSFAKYRGSVHCLMDTLQKEGPAGLYRGMVSAAAARARALVVCARRRRRRPFRLFCASPPLRPALPVLRPPTLTRAGRAAAGHGV